MPHSRRDQFKGRPMGHLKTFILLLFTTALHYILSAADALLGINPFKNLEYAKAQGKSLLLDLFVPGNIKEKLPLIVWIHGGGWDSGDKENCPALMFAKKGYAVASINYRLTQEAVFPAQIHDCKASIRFLRANASKYNIDPDRIGVCGGSAGGHLVTLLGMTHGVKELEGDGGNPSVSSRVQAVCDFFGPTDFIAINEARLSGNPKSEQKLRDFNVAGDKNVVTRLLGGTVENKKELAEQASPLYYAKNVNKDKKDFPPFLIMHGDKDPIVPVEQSISFNDALNSAGLDSTLRIYKGAGHGNLGGDSMKALENFFEKHLKVLKSFSK